MSDQYNRLRIMVQDDLDNLQNKTVAVIGIGGVGSFAIETLARCGIKKLVIVDKDDVDITNLNRQLIALHSTVGKSKAQLMKKRVADINPDCEVVALQMFFNEENQEEVFEHEPDFVIDACDTISAKFLIITECLKRKIKFISSMGAANKFDATRVNVVEIKKTYNDPIARVLRNKLKKEKIKGRVMVAFSSELPSKPQYDGDTNVEGSRKALPLLGSNAFVPSTIGIICANYCFKILIKK